MRPRKSLNLDSTLPNVCGGPKGRKGHLAAGPYKTGFARNWRLEKFSSRNRDNLARSTANRVWMLIDFLEQLNCPPYQWDLSVILMSPGPRRRYPEDQREIKLSVGVGAFRMPAVHLGDFYIDVNRIGNRGPKKHPQKRYAYRPHRFFVLVKSPSKNINARQGESQSMSRSMKSLRK